MIYYSEYDFLFLTVLKSGSTVFKKLFEFVIGRESDAPYFKVLPKTYITVVRNPYDRLVTQFYHANKNEIYKDYKFTTHQPLFKKWVKETFEDGYKGDDWHMHTQSHLLQHYENNLPYKIFKLEELIPHELFFFLDLSEERKKEIDDEFPKIMVELEKSKHHTTNNIKQGVWQIYYDSKTIEICNKHFINDFVAFNYEIIEPEEFKPTYFEYKVKLI